MSHARDESAPDGDPAEGAGDPISRAAGSDGAGTPDEAAHGADARSRTRKAPNAFRTISEVADELHIPQHVLRFWETKFPQVKPLKRGGGRRYYRPDDIALLRRISDLLYTQGYTIKGVQRLVREGDGRLSDHIPPAPAGERDEGEAERGIAEPDDMDLPPEAPEAAALPAEAEPAVTLPDPEAEQLRALLTGTLRELEALRALLA